MKISLLLLLLFVASLHGIAFIGQIAPKAKHIDLKVVSHCVWRTELTLDLTNRAGVTIKYTREIKTSYSTDITSFNKEVESDLNKSENKHHWGLTIGAESGATAPFIANVKLSVQATGGGEYTNELQHTKNIEKSFTEQIVKADSQTTTVEVEVVSGGHTAVWILKCSAPGFWQESAIKIQPDCPEAIDIPLEYKIDMIIPEPVPLVKYKWDFVQESDGKLYIYDLTSPEVEFINDDEYTINGGPENLSYKIDLDVVSNDLLCGENIGNKDETSVLFKIGKWSINEEEGVLIMRDISQQPEQSLFKKQGTRGQEHVFRPGYRMNIGTYSRPTDEERTQDYTLVEGKRWKIAVEQGMLVFRDMKCSTSQKPDCSWIFYRRSNSKSFTDRENKTRHSVYVNQCLEMCGSECANRPVYPVITVGLVENRIITDALGKIVGFKGLKSLFG